MHVVVFVANNCRLGGIGCIAADRGWGGGVYTYIACMLILWQIAGDYLGFTVSQLDLFISPRR